jgi:hypothetical protein
MREIVKSAHRDVLVRAGVFLLLLLCIMTVARAQARPDFSGLWMQDNERSQPKRNSDMTLSILRHDPELTIETSISKGSLNSRHAVQKYTTDGKVSVSTGADGDEFHTSVVWKGPSLVFSIEEHEEGRILRSQETWSLIDDDAILQRTRERPHGEKQILIFRHPR